MSFLKSLKATRPSAAPEINTISQTEASDSISKDVEQQHIEIDLRKEDVNASTQEPGVARVEALQVVWGKKGRYILIAGLAMLMLMYELDNATVYNYQNYASSSFNQLSKLASLGTAGTIIFAVVKPPIAKLSNVIGRGETYCITIACYILSYIICATAPSFNAYAAGYVLYCIGQSGTNIMNDIMISDISSARWRGFAIAISFYPFLFTPWISAFIVQSVIGGIGWRWGIGMFAILMPFAASFIISTLIYYQHKAKKAGILLTRKLTLYDFCSQVDLGGIILLSAGLALTLLPLTLAATTTSKWSTPWIPALLAIGLAILIILPFYESKYARYPLVPIHYFKNLTILSSILLIFTDSLGFSCTHTYLYAWAIVARNFSPRDATFYTYTNGVTQSLSGMIVGLLMYRYRRYKYILLSAIIIRTIGYGVMIRLRGAENPTAELFLVQAIQGLGSGMIQIGVIVASQVVVPHAQMATVTALVLCASFVGSSVGASIAGAIYSNTFLGQLRSALGLGADEELIMSVFNSITGVLPIWGSVERIAIDVAYSDVLRFMTYAALASCGPSFVFVWFLPDLRLPDEHEIPPSEVEGVR